VRAEIERQQQVLTRETMPDERPATRCKGSPDAVDGNRPSECGHLATAGVCGRELPKNWAGRLPRLQGRKATTVFSMTNQAIEGLNPGDPSLSWTPNQRRCIEAVQLGSPVVDRQGLRRELDRLCWPIAYVDFEFDPGMAVPRFPGCRPYDVLPFQWSMLVQEEPDGELVGREPFLHLDPADPRRSFAESLLAAVPSNGSIVAHYAVAERRVINQIADRLGGEVALRLRTLDSRFLDTKDIAGAGYYHAAQQGSYSIKKLAPALLGTGYEDLAIKDGMAAVIAWRSACRERDRAVRERLRSELLAYCGRDTRLMHQIVDRLRALAS
jgi:hypothetical protein